MSVNITSERRTNTCSKNGKTAKTEKIIETCEEPNGKITKTTTIVEITTGKDESTSISTTTKRSTETSFSSPANKGYLTESEKKQLKKEKKKKKQRNVKKKQIGSCITWKEWQRLFETYKWLS